MQTKNKFPWYAPLFWHGMPSRVWWPLLKSHDWSFDWKRLHFVTSVSLTTLFTDPAAACQHLLFGKAIEATKLVGPPVFILGHWRSGTTLLHELLHLDDRFASPNTYQCFAPWHFLLTEGLMTRFGNFLVPKRRPMDNMKAGWKLPQEDEFALMALGAESSYTRIAFPRYPVSIDTLATGTFPPDKLEPWKRNFEWLLKALTYRLQKTLILKSPPHTGRLGLLSQMYPDAKFVHISRNPMSMIPSTIKLWKSLDHVQGLQAYEDDASVEDYVFNCFERMYEGYNEARPNLPADRLIEIEYETLIADPVASVEKIYDRLGLGQFESVRQKVHDRMDVDRDYQTNVWKCESSLEEKIKTRCKQYCDQYAYASS